MAAATLEKTYTPEEFMALPIKHAELIDGKVIEKMPAVFRHDELVLIVGNALRRFAKRHNLGRVAGGGSFLTENGRVRGPDVSFLCNADLEGENLESYIQKPPTLAVEVISQNDTYGDVDDKADEFLRAGSKAVWVINPRRLTVAVHTPDEGVTTYKMGQSVPGGEIFPGFELPVSDIFED